MRNKKPRATTRRCGAKAEREQQNVPEVAQEQAEEADLGALESLLRDYAGDLWDEPHGEAADEKGVR